MNSSSGSRLMVGRLTVQRRPRRSDMHKLYQWARDPELHVHDPWATIPADYASFEAETQSTWLLGDPRWHMLIIATPEGEPIGFVTFFRPLESDDPNRIEIGILLGEKNYWRKGFATDAILTATKYVFEELQAPKVYADVSLNNEAAIALFRRCGYSDAGTVDDVTPSGDAWKWLRLELANPQS